MLEWRRRREPSTLMLALSPLIAIGLTMLLGMIVDDEYQDLAKRYNVEKAGPGKDALLKEAYVKMDEVIDWFARAIAASEGKPEYAQLQQQLMQNLEAYYKSRNNGSTQGMKELIQKYKKS